MSRPTLDAAALAARMNARPLPEDCDGGEWEADTVALDGLPCEACKRGMTKGERCVTCFPCAGEVLALCLPCALADCERAEADHRATLAREGVKP